MTHVDAYPLSPLQQGMLFSSLAAPGTGTDIEHLLCVVEEPLDRAALSQAWQRTLDRHPVLRTRFAWKGIPEPLQVVEQDVAVPIEFHDIRAVPRAERDAWIEEFRQRDRLRGFKMGRAPLMRVNVFELDESTHAILWTVHHILVDGRAMELVLLDVFQHYEALSAGQEIDLPTPRPYRDFIDWLRAQDPAPATRFFRDLLQGFPGPTVVATRPAEEAQSAGVAATEIAVDPAVSRDLERFAQRAGVTLNTLIQGAWALWLHGRSRSDDIVFGATRACRHGGPPGAASMIGLLINTLPVRTRLVPGEPVDSWLRRLREQHVAIRPFEQIPLCYVQQWFGGSALFESAVVFESQDIGVRLRARGGRWLRRDVKEFGQTSFPIVLGVFGAPVLTLRIDYDRRRFDRIEIERGLAAIADLLARLAAEPLTAAADLIAR